MKNTPIYTATDAREQLFEILNIVFYGGEEVLISKKNKVMVKIVKVEVVKDKKRDVTKFAGILTEKEGNKMKQAIQSVKNLPLRAT